MPLLLPLIAAVFFMSSPAFANQNCFLVKEGDRVLQQEGECTKRYSPASTFKIPLSLMGFDAGILQDAEHPEWAYKEEYNAFLNMQKFPLVPYSWMRDSAIWFSQVLTQKLGMEKFQHYVDVFHYGNQDLSGDKGKNDGLTRAWLSSSLEISPEEQVRFLQQFHARSFPLSKHAYDMTKQILYKEDFFGGWKLYGKTGRGINRQTEIQNGWFVGWIEKDGRIITFAHHVVDDRKDDAFASFRARDEAKNKLFWLIEEMAKWPLDSE